jgi:SAM-dependent methyltransferase
MAHKHRETKRKQKKPYWVVSRFYDELWPRRSYAWRTARRRLLSPVLKRSRTVCELGCGTGANSIEFARRGLKVFALDLSAEMCRVTREKARKKRVNLVVIQADMRTFRLREPVDLVASEWGPINHLRRKADLLKVTRSVARALRPGGYFYFDLHQRRLFEGWTEPAIIENRRFLLLKQGGYLPQLGRGWAEFTFYIPDARGSWTRHTDLFIQVHWSHTQVMRALRRSGFNSIRLFDFHDLHAPPSARPSARSVRTMYLARKALHTNGNYRLAGKKS